MSDFFVKDEYDGLHMVGEDFSDSEASNVMFYDCTFERCSFQNAVFNSCHFDRCSFVHCNMTMLALNEVRCLDAEFTGCKLLGVNWSHCVGICKAGGKSGSQARHRSGFKVAFIDCLLTNNTFGNMNLQHIRFSGCELEDASFITVDLSHAAFLECNLARCHFEDAILYKTDFSTAKGYELNAERNTLAKAKFSLPEAISLLRNFDIELL